MRLFVATLALLFIGNVQAQTLSNESMLIEFYGQSKFDELLTKNPGQLEFQDARIEYGYDVIDYDPSKMGDWQVLSSITYKTGCVQEKDGSCKDQQTTTGTVTAQEFIDRYNAGTLNILKYNIKYSRSEITYYVLGSTGKVIMLYPVDYIAQKSNQ